MMESVRELTEREKYLLNLLAGQQAFYDCPKDSSGKCLGKLVGYAAEYEVTPGGEKKHFVGLRYWNVPRGTERCPVILGEFVNDLLEPVRNVFPIARPEGIDCMLGCPEGGKIPAWELARQYGCYYSAADKKVVEVSTETSREKSKMIFGRHTIEKGWRVALVEELVNNLSTTYKAIEMVESAGAIVVALLTLVNRSPEGVTELECGDRKIPIFQSVLIPTPEYRQDDPYVKTDIEAGNVVWKPKDCWDKLIQAA